MDFEQDIKSAMRDCILKIFWPKDHIIQFFESNSCLKKDIQKIGEGNYKELNRAQIVDSMFAILSSKPDNGIGQFRSMLQSLINWSHFDSYYFDDLKKLSREDARRAIDHLAQVQEIRDSKIKKQRQEKQAKESLRQSPQKVLSELKSEYLSLLQDNSERQTRGYKLEKIILDLCKLSSLEITEPFKIIGEQIDGAIKYDGEHYLIEAKWQEREASNEPVYQFAGKVEGKMYGRGLFISVHGFSENVLQSLIIGKAIKTIFIDGGDLILILDGYYTFSELLDKKIKAAQTRGLIYIDVNTGKSKL